MKLMSQQEVWSDELCVCATVLEQACSWHLMLKPTQIKVMFMIMFICRAPNKQPGLTKEF